MCDGCWLASAGCAGAEKAYALAPVHGQANGMHMPGVAISKEDARVSVAYCAEQMKNEPDCSKQFIGVSMKDGQCWCAKENGNCDNLLVFTSFVAHFFQLQKGSEEVSEGKNEDIFERSLVVASARRLSKKSMHDVIYVFVWILVISHLRISRSFWRFKHAYSFLLKIKE